MADTEEYILQPYNRKQNNYGNESINNQPLYCGDLIDGKIARLDMYANPTIDAEYKKYIYVYHVSYDYTSPIAGLRQYVIIKAPDNWFNLTCAGDHQSDGTFATEEIPIYYPKGMLIEADAGIYVTNGVCKVSDFRGNSTFYSSLFGWGYGTEAKAGGYYVYNGNIYVCNSSCTNSIPDVYNPNFSIIQEAPATRFDAVIPLVFIDDRFSANIPDGTLIANGQGQRSDFLGGASGSGIQYLYPFFYDKQKVISNTHHLENGKFTTTKVDLNKYVGIDINSAFLNVNNRYPTWLSNGYFTSANPLQIVPTGMINGENHYSTHCSMFGCCYSDGNYVIRPTVSGWAGFRPEDGTCCKLQGCGSYNKNNHTPAQNKCDMACMNKYSSWSYQQKPAYTRLYTQKYFIHSQKKIPLSVFDLIHLNSHVSWHNSCRWQNALGTWYTLYAQSTFNSQTTPAITDGAMPECRDTPAVCHFFYAPDAATCRNQQSVRFTSSLFMTTVHSLESLVDKTTAPPIWVAKGRDTGSSTTSTATSGTGVGYILPSTTVNIVILSLNWIHKSDSLVAGIYVYKDYRSNYSGADADDNYNEKKVWHILKDDAKYKSSPDAFLNDEECCEYCGVVDVCTDIVISMSSISGVKYEPGSIIWINKRPYKVKDEFTANDNPNDSKKHGDAMGTEDPRGFIEVTDDELKDIDDGHRKDVVSKDGGDTFKKLPNGDREYNPKSPNIKKLFKDDKVTLPVDTPITDCDWNQGVTGVQGKLDNDVDNPKDNLKADDYHISGITIGKYFLAYFEEYDTITKDMYFVYGDNIYKATKDISGGTPDSSNSTVVGERIKGFWTFYSDCITEYSKDMYILDVGNSILFKAKKDAKIEKTSDLLNQDNFGIVGLYVCFPFICDDIPCMWSVSNKEYPDCYEETPGNPVIDEITVDVSGGHSVVKGNLIYSTQPIGGNLMFTGSTYVKKYGSGVLKEV